MKTITQSIASDDKIKYLPKIDGLRFIAISMVLLEHYVIVIGKVFQSAFYGVQLFFVISGFLITSILIRKEAAHSKNIYPNFLGRRVLRIFPIYYLVFLVVLMLNDPTVHKYALNFATYTYNYAWPYYGIPVNPLMHFWSLCVEEQFYLFYPVVGLLLGFRSDKLLGFLLLLICIADSQNLFNVFGHPEYNYPGLLTNMSPLGLGCLGAILAYRKAIPQWVFARKTEWLMFAILLLSFIFFKKEVKAFFWGFINLYLVLKAALSRFELKFFDKLLSNKKIIYIGQISYGLYVYHFPVGIYLDRTLKPFLWNHIPFSHLGILSKIEYNAWVITLPIYTVISFFVAHLSYTYFEKPLLRLKDKFFQGSAHTVQTAISPVPPIIDLD
jgi:peptidoglycan/LPS O-acetylase OafA/YrhL